MNPTAVPSARGEGRDIAAPRLPSITRCGVVLVAIIGALRTLGFARTLRLVRSSTRRVPATADVPFETAELIAHRVATVSAFYPGRARCLEQAMTLYYCLRRLGIPAVLRLGVQPVSFAAHAWIEYQGLPVHEGEVVRTVIPFPEIPA
jgi:hypothetical protein